MTMTATKTKHLPSLQAEAEAARTLLLNLRDVIGDDDATAQDMIEGETSLMEAIDAALDRLNEIDAFTEAITAMRKKLGERSERLENQAERIRTSLSLALSMSGLRKVERPIGTLSLRAVAPAATITNEADIPSQFWKAQPPKLDKKAILDALKDGVTIAGAELSNGGETISIRKV